jgi:hypothetical protein
MFGYSTVNTLWSATVFVTNRSILLRNVKATRAKRAGSGTNLVQQMSAPMLSHPLAQDRQGFAADGRLGIRLLQALTSARSFRSPTGEVTSHMLPGDAA